VKISWKVNVSQMNSASYTIASVSSARAMRRAAAIAALALEMHEVD
jgi:hypothetical protein